MATVNVEVALAEQKRVIQHLVPVWLVIGFVLVFLADATFEKLFVLAFVPWVGWITFGLAIFALAIHNVYLFGRLGRFRRGMATFAALPVAAAVLAAGAPLLARAGMVAICCAYVPDDLLIRRFDAHRQDFERLVEMSEADARVIRIAPDFTRLHDNWGWPRPDSLLGFSRERWQDYRSLFRTLDLSAGLERGEGNNAPIYLLASTQGMVTGGSTKGYVYSPTPLAPTYSSLDVPPPDIRSNVPVYRHLSGPWYLFYSWDD